MNYKRTWSPKRGLHDIVSPGDAGLQRIRFGVLSLAAGETFARDAEDKETALIILGGTCTVRGERFAFEQLGQRKDVFSGKAASVYLPAGNAYTVEAATDVEVAVCRADSDRAGSPRVILPDEVKEVTIGKDNWTRTAYLIVGDDVPAHYLFIGEAIVPPGNWASFPPHRHDEDALPDEVDMEEIYFFRFDRPGGFGIQKIYTDDRSIDETITFGHNDVTLLPEGYHPVVAAPGYKMYYLWIMAGVERKFISRPDPAHRWVAQA
ncbi:MAG: 5-deoxy-glucuronate isomerase [Thermoguttaceae bacterium]|jgi:5-deoxy-glucuronate isomerase|nr:5-deoxy-glucuronate isomerase [Thermoguttaceae bacterium]